jgi:hypothetical protein
MKKLKLKMHGLLLPTMLMLSIGLLTLPLAGCRGHLVVISADREIIPMPARVAYTPSLDGWFVPDAAMLDIKNALDKPK